MIGEEHELRRAIVEAARALVANGLTHGTSGNISVRLGDDLLVTPSGVPADVLTPEVIARMAITGGAREDEPVWQGPLAPSTEWRFHRDILASRPDVGAIVHAHPPYATALAIARREIPACHYMVAAFGGAPIRCGGYALFGTAELSREAVAALEGRLACLLANHGMIVMGPALPRALWLAGELEVLARHYVLSLGLPGGPVMLSEDEIAAAVRAFAGYGPKRLA